MLVGLGDSPAAACHVVTLGNQLLYKQMLNRSVSILLAPDPPTPPRLLSAAGLTLSLGL